MWSLLEKSFSILFLAGSDKVKLSLTVMEYYMVMSHNGDKIPTSNFTECGGKFHQNSQPLPSPCPRLCSLKYIHRFGARGPESNSLFYSSAQPCWVVLGKSLNFSQKYRWGLTTWSETISPPHFTSFAYLGEVCLYTYKICLYWPTLLLIMVQQQGMTLVWLGIFPFIHV